MMMLLLAVEVEVEVEVVVAVAVAVAAVLCRIKKIKRIKKIADLACKIKKNFKKISKNNTRNKPLESRLSRGQAACKRRHVTTSSWALRHPALQNLVLTERVPEP